MRCRLGDISRALCHEVPLQAHGIEPAKLRVKLFGTCDHTSQPVHGVSNTFIRHTLQGIKPG